MVEQREAAGPHEQHPPLAAAEIAMEENSPEQTATREREIQLITFLEQMLPYYMSKNN